MGEEVSGVEEVPASRLSSMAIPESDTHLTAMGLAIQVTVTPLISAMAVF